MFVTYTAFIYYSSKDVPNEAASRGHLVFQKYNCQTCHQLYGLGGYLGPDLTNEYNKPGRSATFIRAMIHSGTKSMPAFQLKEDEMNDLITFFRMLAAQPNADPRNFIIQPNGMTTYSHDQLKN